MTNKHVQAASIWSGEEPWSGEHEKIFFDHEKHVTNSLISLAKIILFKIEQKRKICHQMVAVFIVYEAVVIIRLSRFDATVGGLLSLILMSSSINTSLRRAAYEFLTCA